jgi:histidine ammonia-lyase
VHGASWQVLGYVKEKLEIEMNAATDNPLIFGDGEKVISGGNFHGQPIAFAMDFLKLGMAELANISERRIERLVNPQLNDLPPFLSAKPGLQSGAMIMQYCAASLVSENKTLAHPASVDSIPSSANQEDHVSMGTIGARHAHQIIANVRRVLAIEWPCKRWNTEEFTTLLHSCKNGTRKEEASSQASPKTASSPRTSKPSPNGCNIGGVYCAELEIPAGVWPQNEIFINSRLQNYMR